MGEGGRIQETGFRAIRGGGGGGTSPVAIPPFPSPHFGPPLRNILYEPVGGAGKNNAWFFVLSKPSDDTIEINNFKTYHELRVMKPLSKYGEKGKRRMSSFQ